MTLLIMPVMPVKALGGMMNEITNTVNNNGNLNQPSDDDYTLGDAFRDQANNINKADANKVGEMSRPVSSMAGTIMSVIIYILFAWLAVQTGIDLCYIGLPAVRPLLYAGSQGQQGSNYSGYQQGYNNYQQNGGNYQQGNNSSSGSKPRCLISGELRGLISTGNTQQRIMQGQQGQQQVTTTSVLLKAYFKKRIWAIIILVIVVMLLVSSNIFIKTGMNIGEAILRILGFS